MTFSLETTFSTSDLNHATESWTGDPGKGVALEPKTYLWIYTHCVP